MVYVWDTFETYRLRQADLEGLLRERFGNYEFYINVANGYYRFWVPRYLTEISSSMLKYLFTYLGIHPAYQDAYFSGLDEAHSLSTPQRLQTIPEIGRSGRAVRLYYNMRSVERRVNWVPRDYELGWSVKSIAVYHSFDVESGHSVWLTCDSNPEARDHVKNWISGRGSFELGSLCSRFLKTLTMHLLICEWSVQNWRWYLKELEDEAQKIALETRTFVLEDIGSLTPSNKPVSGKEHVSVPSHMAIPAQMASASAQPTPLGAKLHNRSRTLSPLQSRRGTGNWNPQTQRSQPTPIAGPGMHAATMTSERSRFKDRPPEVPSGISPDEEERLHFKDIQRIDLLEEQASEAVLVLKLNIEIVSILRAQYDNIVNDASFPEEISRDGKVGILQFYKSIDGLKDRFLKQLSRTEKLLIQLDHRKNSTFFMLQYRNMRQSRQSAVEMEKMTKNMEQVAHRTQQEAISMRIITLVTLFFLPATSIATIFGSGMVKFGDNGKRSVWLYLAICMPLTWATFFVWWLMINGIPTFKARWILNPYKIFAVVGSRKMRTENVDLENHGMNGTSSQT
ncbi:hypothetical protein P171DRAFT_359811 [Karstenula rhodostoma CBS 690.94]|uniref:CorA-like transporter domain-containing protein n=1 Tax=Karstenula rhodostoma CBS 690.94 TaxID=1392251 RepID=A0A9P4PGH2_9PLEO|nr:hypothetical protein P171DRAFT_359811 [Karstenula rhodostoma CBS 690.94]